MAEGKGKRPVAVRGAEWVFCACVIIGIGICAASGWGWFSYKNGLGNGPGFDTREIFFLLVCGAVAGLVALVCGIICIRTWRWRGRLIWLGLMLVPALCYVTAASMPGHGGAEQYQRGFFRWIASCVDDAAIRAWLAKTPLPAPPPVASPLAPESWPPELASLHPVQIDLCKAGVIVTFGRFGSWGDQRQVFISKDSAGPDPGIFLWGGTWYQTDPVDAFRRSPWVSIRPGVYAWVESGD